MSFAWPHLLWLLALPFALVIWDLRRRTGLATEHHPKILRAEAGHHHLALAAGQPSVARRGRLWLGLGLALAIVALARPQWGRIEEPVFDQSREIVIAIDLSRSMLAADIKPTRLERAKLLIRSLLEKLAGERVGLIVFSGTAFLQTPLSADYEILREFLPVLAPDYLPEGGTNYSALVDTTLQAFGSGTTADRFLIVLSDGEANDEHWKGSIAELKKKGIRAICLGVGTEAGAMIPDGTGAFVKDERGAVVLSKLNGTSLRELADQTGGTYRDASAWLDLAGVLRATVEAGRKGEFTEKHNVRLVERFQWALAPALFCLLVSLWREFPVRPKPRELKMTDDKGQTADQAQPTGLRAAGTANAANLALLLVLSAICLPSSALAAAPAAAAPAPSPLGKIVGRLAGQDVRTGRDWAEFARETVTWGQKIQSEQRPVPEGPVRDALAAVDLGAGLDAKTADWPQLRRELEALLQQPEPPPQQQKQEQQEKKDQEKQDQQQQPQQDQQKSEQSQSDQQQEKQQQQSDAAKPEEKQGGQQDSAFGDMKEKTEPPPPPRETQKVGGTPEKPKGEKEPADPSLAMPLQKLDQIRNQDSPARLFQLMEGEKKSAPAKPGKNW